jgi:ribulose-phosphate 3-epimerase
MSWREWAREVEIEPSIYAANFAILGEQLEALLAAGARIVHYDAGDGYFIDAITIGPIVLESIAPIAHRRGAVVDCHLMVSQPEKHFDQFKAAGGDSVTFHVEAVADATVAVRLARELELGVGIAFNPETSVDDVLRAADGVDLVLCMSIQPGHSGQKFMPDACARIEELRRRLPEDVLIQVDGGIGPGNVGDVHSAGASLLVAGSAIFWQPDIAAAYAEVLAAATGGR